jgi:hypothetical protein
MVSVVILNNHEPNVVQYTFDQLYTELKDIPGSELLIKDSWDIADVKNRFVAFVEADSLVSPGFFSKQLDALKRMSPRVAVLAPATAVVRWDNIIYGYTLDTYTRAVPNRKQKVSFPHPVQIAFLPGAIIRVSCLKKIKGFKVSKDLVETSASMSLNIWQSGLSIDDKHPNGQLGRQIYLNPEVAYATTEEYVNDICHYNHTIESDLLSLFVRESI